VTVADIEKRVAEILHLATVVDDNVLQAIAADASNATELARAALVTLSIDYTRWHA